MSTKEKVCLSCKPTGKDPTSGVCYLSTEKIEDSSDFNKERNIDNKDCSTYYKKIEDCMGRNKGSISSCRQEWNEFRLCYNSNK
eukprot:gene10554-14180_t